MAISAEGVDAAMCRDVAGLTDVTAPSESAVSLRCLDIVHGACRPANVDRPVVDPIYRLVIEE